MKYQMPESEIVDRLDRIKRYNAYHLKAGQPQHCMTEANLRRMLEELGFDPARAAGVGYVPPPSKIMDEIRGKEAAAAKEEF